MTKMGSPEEMFQAAKELMLDGRDPESEHDWAKVVNFWAVNIAREVQPVAIQLLCKIFNASIDEDYIAKICDFQTQRER